MAGGIRALLFLIGAASCGALQRQSLNGQWTLDGSDGEISITTNVPGGVFSNLMDSGVLDNIFWGYGDYDYAWVGESDWTYTRTFTVDEELLNNRVVSLIFEGLDTFATISINGNEVGTTDNMFVRYAFNIKDQLQVGDNEISVKFTSAVTKAAALAEDPSNTYDVPPDCPDAAYHGICHANRIRKMQASFSWDWGPAFASAGIWKDVYLEAYDNAAIKYVVATPVKNTDSDSWTVFVVTYLDGGEPGSVAGTINITLQLGEAVVTDSMYITPTPDNKFEISIGMSVDVAGEDVELWWPNGYGAQPLYNLTVAFVGDTEQDEKTVRIGFRTIEVIQEAIGDGLSFYFKVNGYPIFAKGSNEIPLSVLPERGQDPDTVRYIMQSARDVHMNMLRVWGGGVYESDYFYDLADEYGLIVWQDFMFACAMYPTDDAFLSTVREEVRHQLKRLGSHTSIAIWSGNNENEGALRDNWYGTSSNFDLYKQDYIKLYVDLIQSEITQILPNVSFVTSSPSNGLETDKEEHVSQWPGNPIYGDIHFYDYTSDSWNVGTYLIPRFSSEYGFQSMPSIEAWWTATETQDDLQPFSDFLNNRQHHPDGNQQNVDAINMQLQLPDSSHENYVKAFIYFSQIHQAQAVKTETEHYRSFKGRLTDDGHGNTMGALYWQLNDVWVAPTWSGIDFTGRWKMLHYQALDFFSPLIVTGRLENTNLEVYAVLDALQVPDVTVKSVVHIYKWDSLEPLVTVEFPVTLDPLAAVLVTTIDTMTALATAGCGSDYEEAKKNCFFHLHLRDQDNNELAPFNYVFADKLRNSVLADANVAIESITATDSEGREFDVVVTTDAVALFVWLDSHEIMGRFSENGFLHVLPSKTVHFVANEPTTAEELTAALTVTHLRDPAYM